VMDQEMKEALSLLLASSTSWKVRYRMDQIETTGEAVRIANESLSLSHCS
jgi:hypothetical protein